MDKIIRPIQEEISIYAQVSLYTVLEDRRIGHKGLVFGDVKKVCDQYGIKYRQLENCMEFTAPKTRLQMFVEKLHFALMTYSEEEI